MLYQVTYERDNYQQTCKPTFVLSYSWYSKSLSSLNKHLYGKSDFHLNQLYAPNIFITGLLIDFYLFIYFDLFFIYFVVEILQGHCLFMCYDVTAIMMSTTTIALDVSFPLATANYVAVNVGCDDFWCSNINDFT